MASKLFLSIMLLFVLVSSAPIGIVGASSEMWKTIGGEFDDKAAGIIVSSDGGYAIAGTTSSFGAGGSDFWLIKVDENGNMEWNTTYGGTESDVAAALICTSDGGYALAGETSSYGNGETDFWLIKVDSSGNVQWNRTFGGQTDDVATCVIQTSDGGYAVAGYWLEDDSSEDALLVKTDSLGNVEWNRTYGGAGGESIYSVVQTSEGGYALAGVSTSYSDEGKPDFWLVKTDPNGIMEWNKTYTEQNTDCAKSLIQTSDGGYTMAGFVRQAIIAPSDVWVIKVDSAGNSVWNVTWQSVEYAMVNGMIQNRDGGCLVSGATSDLNGFLNLSSFMFLIKIDADGTMKWIKTFDGLGDNNSLFVVQKETDGYALAGTTKATDEGTYYDIWFAKTDLHGDVIPEFPSWIILPLFLTATFVGVIVKKRLSQSVT
jgi:predicted secreted protein